MPYGPYLFKRNTPRCPSFVVGHSKWLNNHLVVFECKNISCLSNWRVMLLDIKNKIIQEITMKICQWVILLNCSVECYFETLSLCHKQILFFITQSSLRCLDMLNTSKMYSSQSVKFPSQMPEARSQLHEYVFVTCIAFDQREKKVDVYFCFIEYTQFSDFLSGQ